MEPDQLFQFWLAVLAVVGTLIGGLGGGLLTGIWDRKIRREERLEGEALRLREAAEDVLGSTLNHLVSINPQGNLDMAEGLDVGEVVGALRVQAR